jgi:hypothetical protein
LELFSDDPRPDRVAHQFLEILKATASEDTQQLESVGPTPEYQNVFLRLSRNLAPTENTFGTIEQGSAGLRNQEFPKVGPSSPQQGRDHR